MSENPHIFAGRCGTRTGWRLVSSLWYIALNSFGRRLWLSGMHHGVWLRMWNWKHDYIIRVLSILRMSSIACCDVRAILDCPFNVVRIALKPWIAVKCCNRFWYTWIFIFLISELVVCWADFDLLQIRLIHEENIDRKLSVLKVNEYYAWRERRQSTKSRSKSCSPPIFQTTAIRELRVLR